MIRIGTAGWDYKDWAGIVYPAPRPKGFDPLMEQGKLGAVLVQFPWSFRNTEENQEWLRDVTATFRDYPLAVEVRHDSWLEPSFLRALSEEGVGFVNIDQPQFDDSIGPAAIATAPVGYVRIHGRNYHDWWRKGAGVEARYDYLYSEEEIEPWVERAEEIAAAPETKDVFVVTNNHYKGKAVANALMAKSMLSEGGQKPKAPPSLIAAYPRVLEGRVTPATSSA